MNILVTNIYSWQNKGDAAIVLALIDHLRTEFPGASITLSSFDLDDKGRYGPYPCYGAFVTLLQKAYGNNEDALWSRLCYATGSLAFRVRLSLFWGLRKFCLPGFWLFPSVFAAKLRAYEESDLVVACGGGYLLTTGRPRRLERLLGCNHLRLICLDFYVAKYFSKPFILYNQSVGPFFEKRDAELVKRYLRDAELVICREALSYDRLRAMGLTNTQLSVDVAFGLEPMPCNILGDHGFNERNTNVGITVRRCLPGKKQDDFEQEMALFVETLIAMHPEARFYFMPQVVYAQAGDDDREVAERVRWRLSERARESVAALTEDLHPGALKYLIAQMDYFVGTRMHSNIFALSSLVKTLAISYEPKTLGIMRMLGLEAYVTDADGLDHNRLVGLWDCLVRDAEYVEKLRRKVPEIQASSRVDLRRRLRGRMPQIRTDDKSSA